MLSVNVIWTNANPNTVWNTLARKLGREPTTSEAEGEVKRIMNDALVELAGEGGMPHQRARRVAR